MKSTSIFGAIFFAASALAQTPNSTPPQTLERLCGKLEHVQNLPVNGNPYVVATKRHSLPRVIVSLFSADGTSDCCGGAAPVLTTATDHRGSFEFKSRQLPGGTYWLEVEPNGRKYRMLIRYASRKHSDELCSEIFWQVNDNGDFNMAHPITLD